MRTTQLLLTAALIVLQIADAGTTVHALASGTATEGNPIALMLIRVMGLIPAVVAVKAAMIFMLWFLAARCTTPGKAVIIVLAVLSALYVLVVANNISAIL
jgi:hypothetical protein